MKEAEYKIDPRIVFRETFNSEESVRRNRGVPSNVTFNKTGTATFNGTSSYIQYKKMLSGTYTVRIKLNSIVPATNDVLIDFRNAGTSAGLVSQSSTSVLSVSTGTCYVNGIATTTFSSAAKEIVVSGITIAGTTIAVGSAYGLAANFTEASYELIEIYKGTLSAAEIATMYRNSNAKNIAFRDTDGYPYHYVKIGNQIWLKENLRTNKLPNGYTIPLIGSGGSNDTTWANLTTPGACWYLGDQATYRDYGMLYNWYAIQMIDAAYNPFGWRVSTRTDFNTLITALGGATVAGGKMKEAGTTHWAAGNTGNNSSGFTAFGNGNRIGSNGSFSDIYYGAYYINSTEVNSTNCYRIYIPYTGSLLYSATITKKTGGAIRLIKI